MQKYNGIYSPLIYRRLMLSIAVTCFITNKKQQLFFPEKEEKRKKKKRICKSKAMKRQLSRFLRKKYYPQRSGGVEIFFSKPAGLDLYCW
jgi:hypothetical protein